MDKNERYIEGGIRIQSTAILAGAVLTGAAALTVERLSGQGHPESSPASGSSLIRPAAPGVPEDPQLAPPDKQPPTLNVPTREQQLGWAIVGLGKLTVEEILPAFGACKSSYPAALVSGHPEKARQLADIYGVDPRAIYGYEDFERIRDNGRIDVVYIVLPNSHARRVHDSSTAGWQGRALRKTDGCVAGRVRDDRRFPQSGENPRRSLSSTL